MSGLSDIEISDEFGLGAERSFKTVGSSALRKESRRLEHDEYQNIKVSRQEAVSNSG